MKAESLSLTFANQTLLNDISIEIPPQVITGIFGPSGSGKSLLIKVLSSQVKPDSGKIFPVPNKKNSSYYPPENIAYENSMSLREFIRQNCISLNVSTEERINTLMDSFLLSAFNNTTLNKLPGTVIRKALLCSVLSHNAEAFFLDSPEASLDPRSQIQLKQVLHKMAASENKSICIASNNINFLLASTQRFIAIKKGEIIATGQTLKIDRELIEKLYDIDILFQRNVFTGCGECSFFN